MFNYILNIIILHTILYFTQASNSTLYVSSLKLLKNISISFEKKCSVAYKYNRIVINKPLLNEINIKLSGFLLYISFLARCGYHFDSDNDSFCLFIENDSSLHLPTIPCIIHQSWKNENISSHSRIALNSKTSIDKYASNFLYILWTDQDINSLIFTHFNSYMPYFRKLNMNIKRADLSRYLIIYKFGGLYLDLDFELKESANLILNPPNYKHPVQFVSYRSKEFEGSRRVFFVGNAFFGAIPHSPILSHMIDHVFIHNNQRGRSVDQVLHHTGPFGFGISVKNYLSHKVGGNQHDPFLYLNLSLKESIIIYNGKLIGNYEDKPKFAQHMRSHRWS